MRSHVLLFLTAVLLPPLPARAQADRAASGPHIELRKVVSARLGEGVFAGRCEVFEDRAGRKGRKIALNVLVLRATGPDRQPDPVFPLAGGPGQAATSLAARWRNHWMRRERDIVLVDQRGTGRSNPLRVQLPGSDDDVQGYLDPIFDVESFRRALARLARVADLTRYTTPLAMDDLDDVRAALGYRRINLVGGSYGTRAGLVYLRRHPERVRSAILTGVAPIAFTNPLYHAWGAQRALDLLLQEVAEDPAYDGIYDDLGGKLDTVLARLAEQPAQVTVAHPATRKKVTLRLTRDAFAEALRVMLYYLPTNRVVPLALHRAYAGRYETFVEIGLRSNRRLRNSLCFGMLMSVVGSEDIPRIDPASIAKETAGTFLGDGRVRRQMAVAEFWPRGEVPADYGDPVRSDAPVLIFSGNLDAVTPPRWGAEAARHLPNNLHVVHPGAHEQPTHPGIRRLMREFLSKASVEGLDASFVRHIRLPKCRLPRRRKV